jgi:hypothetical protein
MRQPDGDALNRAKRWSAAQFEKEVARQRKLGGFTDKQLAQAMAESRVLIDPFGSARPPKRPRYGTT